MPAVTTKNIVLIGAGNVGTHLGMALYDQGYLISQVYSPTKKSASALAKKIKSEAVTDLKKLNTGAFIYIITVKDDAIEKVAKQLNLKDRIVVHTSGSMPMNLLKGSSQNYGVFYPLQTFSKDKTIDFKTVPVCIEANNATTSTTLRYFAKSISNNVQKVNTEQRKLIHIAAVFANNFTNHLYTISKNILEKNKMSFDLLKPLIQETADKIKNNSPVKMQTGPAIRKDKKTIKAHLDLLKREKEYKQLYKLLSRSIANQNKNK